MARTNIVLDDDLVARAMKATGARTKRQVVDIALHELVRRREVYRKLHALKGKLTDWDGDIDAWRRSRSRS